MGLLYSILDSLGNESDSLIFEPHRKMDSKKNSAADTLILLRDLNKRMPTEIIGKIMEFTIFDNLKTSKSKKRRYNGRNDDDTVYLQIYTPDFMQGGNLFEVDKVLVRAKTKDQGWSSHPQLHGSRESHSWLELSINDHTEGGLRTTVMNNVHASRDFETVEVEYASDTNFVQHIRNNITQDTTNNLNDESDGKSPKARLCLHARSQYPAWRCVIDSSEIIIYYRINYNRFVERLNLSNCTAYSSCKSELESSV